MSLPTSDTSLIMWLLQQAPSVVILAILCVALWRRDAERGQQIAANTAHITELTRDIQALTDQSSSIERLIITAATASVGIVILSSAAFAFVGRRNLDR